MLQARLISDAESGALARANAPDSASLINLACSNPRTRAWLLWRVAGDWSRLMESDVLAQLVA